MLVVETKLRWKSNWSIRAAASNTFRFAETVEAQPVACRAADTHRDDIAIWLFTSGSTGHPKGAVHLQHDLPYNTEVFAKRTLGVNENDLTVSVPKLFFGYATGTNLLFPFAVGGATALFSRTLDAGKNVRSHRTLSADDPDDRADDDQWNA